MPQIAGVGDSYSRAFLGDGARVSFVGNSHAIGRGLNNGVVHASGKAGDSCRRSAIRSFKNQGSNAINKLNNTYCIAFAVNCIASDSIAQISRSISIVVVDVRIQIDGEGVLRVLIRIQTAGDRLLDLQIADIAGVGEGGSRLIDGNLAGDAKADDVVAIVSNIVPCRITGRGVAFFLRLDDHPCCAYRQAGQGHGLVVAQLDGGFSVLIEGDAAVGAGQLLVANTQRHGKGEALAKVSGVVADYGLADLQFTCLAGIGERSRGGYILLDFVNDGFYGHLVKDLRLVNRERLRNGILDTDRKAADSHFLTVLQREAGLEFLGVFLLAIDLVTAHTVLEVQVAVLASDSPGVQSDVEAERDVFVRFHIADHSLADDQAAILAGVGEVSGGDALVQGGCCRVVRLDRAGIARLDDSHTGGRLFCHCVGHAGGQAGDGQLLVVLQFEGVGTLAGINYQIRSSYRNCFVPASLLNFDAGQNRIEGYSEFVLRFFVRTDGTVNLLGNVQLAGLAGIDVGGRDHIAIRIGLAYLARALHGLGGSIGEVRLKVIVRGLEDRIGHLSRDTLDGQHCTAGHSDFGTAIGKGHRITAVKSAVRIVILTIHEAALVDNSLESLARIAAQVTVEGDGVLEFMLLIVRNRADNRLLQQEVSGLAGIGDLRVWRSCHISLVRRIAGHDLACAVVLTSDLEAGCLNIVHLLRHNVLHIGGQALDQKCLASLHIEGCAGFSLELASGDGCIQVVLGAVRIILIELYIELKHAGLIHVQRAINHLGEFEHARLADVDKLCQVSAVLADDALIANLLDCEVRWVSGLLFLGHSVVRALRQVLDHHDLPIRQGEGILAVTVCLQCLNFLGLYALTAFDDSIREGFLCHRFGPLDVLAVFIRLDAVQCQGEVEFLLMVTFQLRHDRLADDQAGLSASIGALRLAARAADGAGLAGPGLRHAIDRGLSHGVCHAHRQVGDGHGLGILQGEGPGAGASRSIRLSWALNGCRLLAGLLRFEALQNRVECHGEGILAILIAGLVAGDSLGDVQFACTALILEVHGQAVLGQNLRAVFPIQQDNFIAALIYAGCAQHRIRNLSHTDGRSHGHALDDSLAIAVNLNCRFAVNKLDLGVFGRRIRLGLAVVVVYLVLADRQLSTGVHADDKGVILIMIRLHRADNGLVDHQVSGLTGVCECGSLGINFGCRILDNGDIVGLSGLCLFGLPGGQIGRLKAGQVKAVVFVLNLFHRIDISCWDTADGHDIPRIQIHQCLAIAIKGHVAGVCAGRAVDGGVQDAGECTLNSAITILQGNLEAEHLVLIHGRGAVDLLCDRQRPLVLGIVDGRGAHGYRNYAGGRIFTGCAVVGHGEAGSAGLSHSIGHTHRQAGHNDGITMLHLADGDLAGSFRQVSVYDGLIIAGH